MQEITDLALLFKNLMRQRFGVHRRPSFPQVRSEFQRKIDSLIRDKSHVLFAGECPCPIVDNAYGWNA